ncbi:MAG: glycine cleavage system protein GcvH [Dehalococcoidia bacterium]|nr:glycine cleavage system protein GcvH [Dehalococcoidia bacterium]MDW8120534.1 glycine cleavage system protein GcvH [Chloroflexota bacterium]
MPNTPRTPYYPSNLRYTKEHEWVRLLDDGTALVGITYFAQDQLGDVVFLNLPKPGDRVVQMKKMGEVESVKAVSDLFSPISGEVLEVNREAVEHPEVINQDPYGKGWLLKVRPSDPKELNALLTAQEYEAYVAGKG